MIEFKKGDIVKLNPNVKYSNIGVEWTEVIIKCIKDKSTFIIINITSRNNEIRKYKGNIKLPFEPFFITNLNQYFLKIQESK